LYESQTKHQPGLIESKRQSLADDIATRARHWSIAGPAYRASVPPARVLEFVRELKAFAADPTFGIVVGAFHVDDRHRLRERAADVDGTITFNDKQEPAVASATESALLRRLNE